MNRLLFSAAVGAAAMYFLDPQAGRRRRVRTRDKAERVARRVANELAVHQEAGNVSSLQGGVPRRGERFELFQDNWSPAARLAIGGVGLVLLMRRGLLGRLGGAALLARAITNLEFGTLVGTGQPEHGIEVQKTICVNAPVDQVFGFWSDYQNF